MTKNNLKKILLFLILFVTLTLLIGYIRNGELTSRGWRVTDGMIEKAPKNTAPSNPGNSTPDYKFNNNLNF